MQCVPGKQTLKGGKVRKTHMEKLNIDPPPGTVCHLIQEHNSDNMYDI